jgi:hypothetical protein
MAETFADRGDSLRSYRDFLATVLASDGNLTAI